MKRKQVRERKPSEEEKYIHQAHDKVAKALFQDKEIFSGLTHCRQFPSAVLEQIDENSVEMDDTTYISQRLKGNYSDLVYNGHFKDKEEFAFALLLENKFQTFDYIHIQFLTYMPPMWKRDIAVGKKPRVIIPIVFYHGKEKWNQKPFTDVFPYLPTSFEQYVPKFEYVLISIHDFTLEEILKMPKDTLLRNLLLCFKKGDDKEYLLAHANEFVDYEPENFAKSELFNIFVEYLLYISQFNEAETNTFFEKIESETIKSTVMSTAQNLIAK